MTDLGSATAPDALLLPETERIAVSVRSILVGSGPRFARDAFGPTLVFYAAYKVGGLVVAIVAATIVSAAAWQYERRHDRSGLLAWLTLLIVGVQAAIGLVAGDARAYLAPSVLATLVWGVIFLGSVAVRRPLAGLFACEMYPFPIEVRLSMTFRRTFSIISIAWGALLIFRSATRLATLSTSSIDAFVGVSFLTGVPLTAAMMAWSVWYATRSFRRSAEWGWALQ